MGTIICDRDRQYMLLPNSGRFEDVHLVIHNDSVDDCRSDITDNAVGAAADDDDVIMDGLDGDIAVAADRGSPAAVSDASGDNNNNHIPSGFDIAKRGSGRSHK